jgi:tetratricopeptide (TPR) repeat protein
MRVAIWHYARGLAYASTGDLQTAQKERQSLAELDRTMAVPGVAGWQNGSKQILGIALDVLDAKLALARGKAAVAVPLLARAVTIQDTMLYIEPPDWYYPVRESLGAAMLRAGDAKGAERTFRDDLLRNPRSGRSLFGLAESLKAQGDATDAAWSQRAFAKAWKNADTQPMIDDM